MEYSSFYGGRKGAPFTIVKSFRDIPSMTRKFGQGTAYSEVAFGEYVIINTVDKNHRDNGKLFRRGYDLGSGRKIPCLVAYINSEEVIDSDDDSVYYSAQYDPTTIDANGAEYVGTIVGPSGRAPHLKLDKYDNIPDITLSDEYATGGTITYTANIQHPLEGDLVPAKYYINNQAYYCDAIKWKWASTRNPDNTDTVALVGLQIPYPIVEFSATQSDPYTLPKTERTDEKDHPYYQSWNIQVPKGIKGDALKNFRIMEVDSSIQGTYIEASTGNPHQFEEQEGKTVLVYDVENYNNENSSITHYYLGAFNQIEDVNLSEDGVLTMSFSYQEDFEFRNIKWIKEINFSAGASQDAGKPNYIMTVVYNTGTGEGTSFVNDTISQQLDFIYDVNVSEDGVITFKSTVSGDIQCDTVLKTIDDITYQDGLMTIIYNTLQQGSSTNHEITGPFTIRGIDDISQDNGTVTITYNTLEEGSTTVHETESFILKEINDISQDNGTVTITYNTLDGTSPETTSFTLKEIDNISYQNGQVIITYNTLQGTTPETDVFTVRGISNISQNNGTVTILYNTDENVSFTLKEIDNIGLSEDGTLTITYNTGVEQGTNFINDIQEFPSALKSISNISYENGQMTVTFNTFAQNDPDNHETAGPFTVQGIESMQVDNEGDLIVNYNTNNSEVLTNVKTVNGLRIENNGTVIADYNINNESEVLNENNPIKYIEQMGFRNRAGSTVKDFIVKYNTDQDITTLAQDIKWINDIEHGSYGAINIKYDDSSIKTVYAQEISKIVYDNNTGNLIPYYYKNGQETQSGSIGVIKSIADIKIDENQLKVKYNGNDYISLGTVRGASGLLIGMNVSWDEIYTAAPSEVTETFIGSLSFPEISDAIKYLNYLYPYGLRNQGSGTEIETILQDKIVTVGAGSQNKDFLGFDYREGTGTTQNRKGWFLIGSLALSEAKVSSIVEPTSASIDGSFPIGGLWFQTEKDYAISYSISSNIRSSNQSSSILEGINYETTLVPREGYVVDSVTVSVNDTTLDNAYNSETGSIFIASTNINGDISISATAVLAS